MLLSEYYSAIPDKNSKDCSYRIGVRNHKTFSYYDQAMVTLNQIEYEWLQVYVEKIRSQLSSSDHVFLSLVGKPMGQ